MAYIKECATWSSSLCVSIKDVRNWFWRLAIQRPALVMVCSSLKYLYLFTWTQNRWADWRRKALERWVAHMNFGNRMSQVQQVIEYLPRKKPCHKSFERFYMVVGAPPIRPNGFKGVPPPAQVISVGTHPPYRQRHLQIVQFPPFGAQNIFGEMRVCSKKEHRVISPFFSVSKH